MQAEEEPKKINSPPPPTIHLGVYINNERRKGLGGRIKSQSITQKIQIMGRPPALHESIVQWTQVRRYFRIKPTNDKKQQSNRSRDNKPKNKKQDKEATNKKIKQKYKEKKQQQIKNQQKKKFKYKEKKQQNLKQAKMDIQNTYQNSQKIEKNISQKKQQKQLNEKIEEIKQQLKQPTNQIDQKPTMQQHPQHIVKQQEQTKKQQTQKDIQSENQQQPKQVIVGRIQRQVTNIYANKNFVGLLSFQLKNMDKDKKIQEKDISIVSKIYKDFDTQIYPINRRLQVMIITNMIQIQQEILAYIGKKIKFTQQMNKNKKCNLILEQLQKVYVLAKFSHWNQGRPCATIIKFIGQIFQVDGQCSSFLHQYGLNDFDHQQELQTQPIKLKPTKYHKNLNRMIFTIDPKTSIDLDDALSIQQINDNIYQIGIHIADVTSYLSQIDRSQLIKRSTSVYLPHKTYHMLPQKLTTICSINPQVERLVFTIFIYMNQQGQIVRQSKLQKNIVTSRFKLSYQQVQDILVKKNSYQNFNQIHKCQIKQYQILTKKLQKLAQLGIKSRQKRILFDIFQNQQVKFQLNQDHYPISVSISKRFTAQKVVEEFMIIGNVEAAKYLVKNNKKQALIIHHPMPSQLSISSFNQYFKDINIKFTFANIIDVQKQLMQVKQMNIQDKIKEVCYFKARRTQQAASYKLYEDAIKEGSQNKIIHFALGKQFYTHFTSPMRRMADIIVHQILNQTIINQQAPQVKKQQLQKINFGRNATKKLKRDITQIYLCLMIRKTSKQIETQGTVLSVGMKSISIYLPLLDNMREFFWRSQLDIKRIYRRNKFIKNSKEKNNKDNKGNKDNKDNKDKNKNNLDSNQDSIRVYIFYDYYSPQKDIFWDIQKWQTVKLFISSTQDAPLRMRVTLEVNTNKGKKKIKPSPNL